MHFAAYLNVGESVHDPLKYYRNNTASSRTLLERAHAHGVKNIVFNATDSNGAAVTNADYYLSSPRKVALQARGVGSRGVLGAKPVGRSRRLALGKRSLQARNLRA